MSKSNFMTVTFRVPNGGGGMVQGISYAELNQSLKQWIEDNGDCFTITNQGYLRTLHFKNKKNFRVFLKTFRPQREHWWENAKLEEIPAIKKEIMDLEKQLKTFAPIPAALNYYIGKKTKLKELESEGNAK